MKKIAILASGEGLAAERIVRLFNEGNRVRTDYVIIDKGSTALAERLRGRDVEIIPVDEDELGRLTDDLSRKFVEDEIELLVDDNFAYAIPEQLIDASQKKLLKVSSPEEAPREVIAVLEEDLRKPKVELQKTEEETDTELSPEHEWAKTLNINFTPPKVPVAPPPLPENPVNNVEPGFQKVSIEVHDHSVNSSYRPDNAREHREVMPPTYLIWAILATVFCCFIPGIVAIVFASQVSTKFYGGDIAGAWRSSRLAEIWIIVSVVVGVVAATLYLPFMLLF